MSHLGDRRGVSGVNLFSDFALALPLSFDRITASMGSVVAGAGVNPADQRWGFWPLLPLRSV